MRPVLLVMAAAGCVLIGLRAAGDPVADFRRALQASEAKQYAVAAPLLTNLSAQLPEVADYVGWSLAAAQSELKNYAAVPPALEAVFAQTPKSPLRGKASLLAADAYVKLNRPEDAIRMLKAHYSETTPPQSDMALADAYAAANDKVNAATYYQRVYYGYPQSPASPRALTALVKLEADLGASYPTVTPYTMLGRALKLLDAGQDAAAQRELEALLPQLTGSERDLARVRIGKAMYAANKNLPAYDYLAKLEVASDEADAERLLYMTQSARRLDRLQVMDQHALRAAELHPKSKWTVAALIAAGHEHLMKNEVSLYEPLYQACYEGAPTDPDSELCHWKATWAHYLRRDRDAALMLRDHLREYPDSEEASAALYFLGRLAEQGGDIPAARTYLAEVAREYPNVFYASQARERAAKLPPGPTAQGTGEFLRTVAFPLRARTHDFTMTPGAQARIQRASILTRAGQKDLAEGELRFGADQGDQPAVLAMELAKLLAGDDPAQAMRYIKRYARGYLYVPIASAPNEFWRMAFPLPYRTILEQNAQQNQVDPFLMAALVRQESEFDARAVSSTGARGLSQIQPTTGRDLAGRLKLTYSAERLFQPAYNLQLGTFYVRWLMNQLNGNMEATLASYNAGMSRAKTWMQWGQFREPAEFIETIPITQTRDYVQAVLRNAAAYREIYSDAPPRAAAE